ncbi:G patch domain and ankyrin repeat-containing protein 1 homolog [Uloborus diversus]|uniref:G patch domain and ankyrin repeat-containing protein 1 homolog n=1 Tax=Uloborus diversus TaxID=327109 RepID=UPI0024092680|nr:G patch domain and ankyrin repeat-containing protein 1 homolog [Uloborus diversus]
MAAPPYQSRHDLQFIPFVSPTFEDNETPETAEKRCGSTLNGEEASIFYNTIISSSSICKNPNSAKSSSRQKNIASKKISEKLESISPPKSVDILSNKVFFYAQEGNLKEIKKCLEQTCCINQQDAYGWTPIMCAAMEGHYSIVKYLLDFGADLSIRNKQGLTVFEIAERGNHLQVIDLLRNGIQVSKISDAVLKNSDEAELKFCKECSLSFKESIVSHEKSIAHLFSSSKAQNSTFYHIPENNKGFQIMLKSGWDKDKGLGINEDGRKFPVKSVLKKDRGCIGRTKETAKITHFGPNDPSSIKHQAAPVSLLREKTLKNRERRKMALKQRQKEISFRRQFHCD